MSKNYDKIAKDVMEKLGGESNVNKMFHCATRLRTDLKNKDIDLNALKNVEGVVGAVESAGGVQVIIGNDVDKVFKSITKQYSIESGQKTMENLDSVQEIEKANEESQNVVSKLLNVLSAIIGPAIPLIMTSGLISALMIILKNVGLSTESSTYTILSLVSTAAFYFLPVLLAYTSAKKFNADIVTSIILGCILISPTLTGLTEVAPYVSLFGIPIRTVNYTSTLIPIVLTIWVFSYVEKFISKIVPISIKFVFKPLFSIVIMVPLMLAVTGPIGSYFGEGLSFMMTSLNSMAPWASVLVVGALAPLLVLTGMHFALIPLVFTMFNTVGYDNMLFVAFIGMNFSQFGVSMAVLFKTKNKNLRAIASSAALTAFLAGVTEPALYGISVRMKRPLIATWIACIANAIFCSLASVKVYSFGAPSFFTMPIFLNPDGSMGNFNFALMATVLTIVVSFAATWILGFDDSVYGVEETDIAA